MLLLISFVVLKIHFLRALHAVYHLDLKFVYLISRYRSGRLLRVQAEKLLTYLQEKRIPPAGCDQDCDTRADEVDLFVFCMYLRKSKI